MDEAASRLGLTLGVVGAVGSAIHGGYDLAISLPVAAGPLDAPNAVDPRGLLTFGAAGLGLLVIMADRARRTVPAPPRLPLPHRRCCSWCCTWPG